MRGVCFNPLFNGICTGCAEIDECAGRAKLFALPVRNECCALGANSIVPNEVSGDGAGKVRCDDLAVASIPRSDAAGHLASAAFGTTPNLHPLPPAGTDEQRWWRAVALGGQGRYAAARAELRRLQRDRNTPPAVLSSAYSTEASLLRQLGRHRIAARYDGHALAVVGMRSSDDGAEAHEVVAARCDALTGLAADALGQGRLAVSRMLLDRCSRSLDRVSPNREPLGAEAGDTAGRCTRRPRIRLSWVRAETALAGADFGSALRYAEQAVAEAATFGSVRHAIKSDLIRAAALTGGDDVKPALAAAEDVLRRSTEHGLLPLAWASAMLLEALGGGTEAEHARRACEVTIAGRGGRFVPVRNG